MIRVLCCTILFFAILESALAASYVPNAFKAEFTQSIKQMNGGTSKSNLLLKYERPGKFYMKVTGDGNDMTYICNKKNSYAYQPPFMEGEQGQVTIGSSAKYCYSKIFDKLRHGLKSNNDYKVKKLNDKAYLFTFTDKIAAELTYKKIEFVFSDTSGKFEKIKTLRMYPVGKPNPTVLSRKRYKKIGRFYKGTFTDKFPKNAKRVYR